MTATHLLQALVRLVSDLAADLPANERYRRLLEALRTLVPCDAAALLRLEGSVLVPVAIDGLTEDTLGRHFRVAEHPRFDCLLSSPQPVHFPASCPLPDPYDGLVAGMHTQLLVHDCMGVRFALEGDRWGLLTADALQPGTFTPTHLDALRALGELAAATLSAVERIERLARRMEDAQRHAEHYRLAVDHSQRELLGQSRAMLELQREIDLVAGSELTVLVQGETGVGKELVAQALHARSSRAARPLVTVNCAALPESLVESELFGHARGAFTGATSGRRGKFELADGGTLFLDEIGELPAAAQAKLLRVLQSGQLQRVGSDEEHQVDVRVIAATNRDLSAEVKAGRMRADIYHRLSVYPLRVPPLREREGDVLHLAGCFLEENRSRFGLGSLRLDREARTALLRHDWPGNVRELEHLVARSVLRALGRQQPRPRVVTLSAADVGLAPQEPGALASTSGAEAFEPPTLPSGGLSLRAVTEACQQQAISQALARADGNWSAAARALQMDRANLARLARRLGVGAP